MSDETQAVLDRVRRIVAREESNGGGNSSLFDRYGCLLYDPSDSAEAHRGTLTVTDLRTLCATVDAGREDARRVDAFCAGMGVSTVSCGGTVTVEGAREMGAFAMRLATASAYDRGRNDVLDQATLVDKSAYQRGFDAARTGEDALAGAFRQGAEWTGLAYLPTGPDGFYAAIEEQVQRRYPRAARPLTETTDD